MMRITSKGQVTIPREIRERAGLLPHTEVSSSTVRSCASSLLETASERVAARDSSLICGDAATLQ